MSDALVAAIENDPYDVENYRVYGDWLEAQDDPRGQLIAMHILRERLTERGKQLHLEKRTKEYMREHERVFLGGLRQYTDNELNTPALHWRYGFIHLVQSRYQSAEFLYEALTHPSARFLAELDIMEYEKQQAAIDTLGSVPPCLRVLRVDLRNATLDFSKLWSCMPRLTKFQLKGGNFRTVMDARLPALEHLEVDCTEDKPLLADLRQFFERTDLPKLVRVKLPGSRLKKSELGKLQDTVVCKQLVELSTRRSSSDA